mmetsp:Transcript_5284/g.9615  ORF Transcript_5284/g.9615 Transcript_5284/m.9615 type:complete len:335 (+) Transcript_5284:362-1366(+)
MRCCAMRAILLMLALQSCVVSEKRGSTLVMPKTTSLILKVQGLETQWTLLVQVLCSCPSLPASSTYWSPKDPLTIPSAPGRSRLSPFSTLSLKGAWGKTLSWKASSMDGTRTNWVRRSGWSKKVSSRSLANFSEKMFSKVTVSFSPSSLTICTAPFLAAGWSAGTKGPESTTTSGLNLPTTARRSAMGSKSKFWLVVNGPAAAKTDRGCPSCPSPECWSLSSSPALVLTIGLLTPSQILEAIIFLPLGFFPSTPTTCPGKTLKVLSSSQFMKILCPPASCLLPSSITVVLLSFPSCASLQTLPITLTVSVLGSPIGQRSFISNAPAISLPRETR